MRDCWKDWAVDPALAGDGEVASSGGRNCVSVKKQRQMDSLGIENRNDISAETLAPQLLSMIDAELVTPVANAIPKLAARYGQETLPNIQRGSRINLGDLNRTSATRPAAINGAAVDVSQNISDDQVRQLSAVVLPTLPAGVQADLSGTLKSVVIASNPEAAPVFDRATGKLVVPAKVFEQPAAIRDLVQVNSQRSEPGVKAEINIADYGFSRPVSNARVVKMDDGRGVEVAAGISDQDAKDRVQWIAFWPERMLIK